jgi:hypothetical protein
MWAPSTAARGVFAMALAACGGTSEPQGTLSLLLKDAPGDDVRAAVVTISSVQLRRSDGRVLVLRNTPLTVDLVTLTESPATLVDAASLPAGSYDELRLMVDGAFIEVAGGAGERWLFATEGYEGVPDERPADGVLQVTPGAASGFEVKLPNGGFRIDGLDELSTLVIDFDVAESFVREPRVEKWTMRPTLSAFDRATAADIEITVKTAPDGASERLAGFQVQLVDAAGHFEGARRLIDPDGDQAFTAHFGLLNPEEGPFGTVLVGPPGLPFRIAPEGDGPLVVRAGGHGAAARIVELLPDP